MKISGGQCRTAARSLVARRLTSRPSSSSSSSSPPPFGTTARRARRSHASRATMPRAMAAEIIDGKAIAQTVRDEVRDKVSAMRAATGKAPGLAVVLVGERKDSQDDVRSKKKACEEAGIASFGTDLPEDATEEEVLAVVAAYNADPNVHGILVQLPMPKHIDEERVLSAIDYEKDVDGFHPLNIGRLSQRGREPLFVPCTPRGCIELLERTGVPIAGKEAVVVGRSNVVGTPAALLLQRRDATVTIVHSRTPNPEKICRRADIVIAACGQMEMVKGSWLKPGCAVIDVGINAKDDATKSVATAWSATSSSKPPRKWPVTSPRCRAASVR